MGEKFKKEFEKIGAYGLVEMTNRVASAANIEHHARIIKQKSFTRRLIKISSNAIREAYKEEKDIFDLYDEVNNYTRANNPKRILRVMKMNEAMKDGKNQPVKRKIIGSLIRERDVTILFGDEGTGKSILTNQIGFAAAEGKPLFDMPNDFPNECDPMRVLIFDFELETNELYERYSEKDLAYNFSDNLYRADMNPDCLDLANGSEKLMKAIQQSIESYQPKFVIVDNISWIVQEAQDSNVATLFMQKILTMQKRLGFSTVIVAHTPKRNTSEPLESKHLAGSKGLSNFTKNLIGVSHSKLDPNKRYIKQLKSRSQQKEYFDQVIECAIEKEPSSAMLEWKFLSVTPELVHLTQPEQDMTKDEMSKVAYRMYHIDKKSWDEIILENNWTCHRTTLWRNVEKWGEKFPEQAAAILNHSKNLKDWNEELNSKN